MKKSSRFDILRAAALASFLAGCAVTTPPPPGPDMSLLTLEGVESRFVTYRGQTTLLHFWATWCATCREELGSLSRVATEVPEVAVVAIAIEDELDAVRTFVENERISFPVLVDRGEARQTFSVPSVPYTVLLDRSGNTRRFLDPKSGEWVSEITEPRYWDNTVAIERVRKSAEGGVELGEGILNAD